MAPTIKQVLANKDQYPASLVSIAGTLQAGKNSYAKIAADAAAAIILSADELTVDAGEQKISLGNLVDLKQSINDRADSAFAQVAADYPDPVVAPPPAPTPPPPPPPAPDAPVG